MEISNMKKLIELNSVKYNKPYYEIKVIQQKFDLIYSRIEKNDLDIMPALKDIENQMKEHNSYRIQQITKTLVDTNIEGINRAELCSILYELNSSIISQIRYDIDKTDFKFNLIRVFVIPEKNVIRVGDTYKARVVIAAIDTTRLPDITLEESSNFKQTYGIIQIKGEKKGKFKSRGNVELVKGDEGKKRIPFNFEYEVQ